VELVEDRADALSPFLSAMTELGFRQTITGRKTRKSLQLPSGMYFIDRADPAKALGLTRQAAKKANVEARIFCVPAGGHVSFGNLKHDEAAL
jgi:hypothetical protein